MSKLFPRTTLSRRPLHQMPLRWVLVIPFVLLMGTVSLVGYLSYRNGQAVVTELVGEIRSEIAAQIEQTLNDHLYTPQIVNQINADALESGLLNAQDLSSLQPYLMQQLRQFPTLSGITIASETPDYIGVLYDESGMRVLSQWNRSQGGLIDSKLDAQGRVLSATPDLDYDHRQRPWYRSTIQAKRPLWQAAYLTLNPARLVISADRPFFDRRGRLLGVVDAEVTLAKLNDFLGGLKIGRTGETFIIEQNGLLIASSASEPPFDRQAGEETRRLATSSSNRLIRAAAEYLNEGDLQQITRPQQLAFDLEGQRQFLTVLPFGFDRGINWLVVVIVPEADFTLQIEAHRHNMLLLCLATLIGAIALSLRTSQWIAQPLLRMSRASAAIAAGQLDQRVAADLPVAELNVMAHSFNRMAQQLGQTFERVTEALQASEAKFTKVFRASPDAIAITTVSGRYVDVNTSFCRISGYDRDEIVGRTPFELQFPLTPEGFTRFGQLLRKRRILRNVEVGFQTKSGEAKTALVSAELIEIEGEPRILTVIKDISDRKRAEAERQRVALERKQIAVELKRTKAAAEAANRAKSQFLANMSHELRSPLNAILGFAQLMALSRTIAPEHREYVNIIHHSGEHLLNLINDILDSSKIEAGCLTLDQSSFDLHRLLQELLEMFRLKAQEKSIALICDAATAPQWICADELKLRQVLINLLSNAIKFTPTGSVTLKVSVGEARSPNPAETNSPIADARPLIPLYFSVADTGIGIDSSQLDDIFEAFVQTSSGRQAADGTGLGLSISRAFVRLMGGDIVVRSAIDVGSVFEFSIAIEPAAPPVLLSAPYRCLVAGDRRDRQQLATLLHPLGYDIREASNGEEAVALWRSWQPHLIWMDVRLPIMDGATAARQIRAQPSSDVPPVIIGLSDGNGADADRSMALAAGCDDFLCRPLQESEIRGTIDKYFGRSLIGQSIDRADRLDLHQQLGQLPRPLLKSLHQATLEGDFDLMLTLIEQIRPQQPSLAEAIATLAHQFQYVQLLALTQPFSLDPSPESSS